MGDPLREAKDRFIAECRSVLQCFGSPEWSSTESQTDDDHISDFGLVLSDTREDHNPPEKTEMHFVRDSATGRTLAIIGNTVDGAKRARAITGILRSMPGVLDDWERSTNRVDELLQHSNEQLMEIRRLRAQIRALEGRQKWLIENIPANLDDMGDE